MSNFQELQANKIGWRLSDDEALSEKMLFMQDNVLASSHLITSSMDELNRAISAAGTTMSNAINAFNQLNYTKFMENKVEDMEEAEQRQEIDRLEESTARLNETSQSDFANENLLERDKITFALELAIEEVTRKKKKNQEEGTDLDQSTAEIQQQKKNKKTGFLGVAASIKLPFVIGEAEYDNHPFAGIVFAGSQYEQADHYQDEQAQMNADKAAELANLDENAARIADQDQEMEANEIIAKADAEHAENEAVNAEEKARLEAEQAAKYVNIPEPPEPEVGNMPPPEGCQPAYCPPLRDDGRILTGRAGGPVAPAPGQAAAAQDAAIPQVQVEQIPEEIRQSLAQAGMPVENMTNEVRMSVALMSGSVVGGGDSAADQALGQSNRASTSQKSMEEILQKAQQMYQLNHGDQQRALNQQMQQTTQQVQHAPPPVQEDDPYSNGVLGKRLDLDTRSSRASMANRQQQQPEGSMWDNTPQAPSNQPAPGSSANPPLKRDLTAMMYGGASPLFDTAALGGDEATEGKPARTTGGMFEDESDDDGEAFLQQLQKPASEQKVQMPISGNSKPKKEKVKSNNPFGSSSEDEEEFGAAKQQTGGYTGNSRRQFNAFLKEDNNDSEEEKFVPKEKPKVVVEQKKKLLESDDDEDSDSGFGSKKPATQKAPVEKSKPIIKPSAQKKPALFGDDDSDDESSDGGIVSKKKAPIASSLKKDTKTANNLPLQSQIPHAATAENQAKKQKTAVRFLDDDDDDAEDSDDFKKKPTASKQQQQQLPADPVRASVASSRASENIRETEVVSQPAPVQKKPESPKEEGKKSIAELQALINPAALGGRPRPGGVLPHRMSAKAPPRTEAVGGVTFDGQMDHNNFAAKPTQITQKKAPKKQNFFSDSDEDSDEKPQVKKPVVQSRPVPVPVPVPQPVVQAPPVQPAMPQVDESTRSMWGDGQWYPDASGSYFYYDEFGKKNYYAGEDEAQDGGYGQQDYAQDQFMQQSRESGRESMMPSRGQRQSMAQRPSITVKEAARMSIKLQSSETNAPQMQTSQPQAVAAPEKSNMSAMDQRAAAMQAAQKKRPAKSKFDSSDENEDSDSDDEPVPVQKKQPVAQPTPAPVQAVAAPAQPQKTTQQAAKPKPKANLFGSDDEDEDSEESAGNTFLARRPGPTQSAATQSSAPPKQTAKPQKPKKRMFDSSSEDDD